MFILDGTTFSTLEEFYDEVSRVLLIPDDEWGHNLDAFNDILRREFGTSKEFVLVWRYARLSGERLGYAETVRQLEARLTRCHPTQRANVQSELAAARRGEGPTVFDWLVEIILAHTHIDLIFD